LIDVAVIRTGTANLASVMAGLARAGAVPRVAESAGDVGRAPLAVLPGVGAFGAAMETINSSGLADSIRERIAAGRPTLGICLGMQALCAGSGESPGVPGLGILPVQVGRFGGGVRVPQLGWNSVEPDDGCALLKPGHAYFANSYRITDVPEGWNAAYTVHGERFVSAVERGAVLACQFHPELSGAWGLELIRRWIRKGTEGV
jgi:imidazole glycerol phosphate synthase glutamine amidotransferase subunit